MTSAEIVNKVWNYAHVLRDDGVGYGDYVDKLHILYSSKWLMSGGRPVSKYKRRVKICLGQAGTPD